MRKDITAREMAALMVDHFRQNFSNTFAWRARDIGFTVRQAVVMASLIEKETANRDERFLVSSVFHNRLRKNMLLDCDSTIVYALKKAGIYDGDIRWADLKDSRPTTPANTAACLRDRSPARAMPRWRRPFILKTATICFSWPGAAAITIFPGPWPSTTARYENSSSIARSPALIEPASRSFAGHQLFIHQEDRMIFGYTTGNFPSNILKIVFPSMPLLFLKQVHSPRIVSSSGGWPAVEADELSPGTPKHGGSRRFTDTCTFFLSMASATAQHRHVAGTDSSKSIEEGLHSAGHAFSLAATFDLDRP